MSEEEDEEVEKELNLTDDISNSFESTVEKEENGDLAMKTENDGYPHSSEGGGEINGERSVSEVTEEDYNSTSEGTERNEVDEEDQLKDVGGTNAGKAEAEITNPNNFMTSTIEEIEEKTNSHF